LCLRNGSNSFTRSSCSLARSLTYFIYYNRALVTLTTGAVELDKLLEGGVETGSITEVFGEFRTGKTQLAHTLWSLARWPTEGGAEERPSRYRRHFRPNRLKAIAERWFDPDVALENVAYARAHNSEHQMDFVWRLLSCPEALRGGQRTALSVPITPVAVS
jgi:hypothetical protein